MFLTVPGLGNRPDALRPLRAFAGLPTRMARRARFLLIPLVLLAFGTACSHSSDSTTTPGTPPSITSAPSNASTVTGRPVTFAVAATGAPTLRYQWAKDGANILGAMDATYVLINPQAQSAGQYAVTVTNPNGTVTSSTATLTVVPALQFSAAVGLASDAAGNLFVSDMSDHVIWKVSAAKQVTLLAGSLGLPGSTDGLGGDARFNAPGGLALDGSGNLLVADTGNHTIRRIAPDGTVTTLAGSPGLPGSVDDKGPLARFNAPVGLAVNGAGGVYISDSQNHTIRLLAPDGAVTTIAGSAGQPGHLDANGSSARFTQPNGLALAPNGTLYVADYGNSIIRAITTAGQVSTLAGLSNTPGYVDGSATSAQFNLPVALALDASGNVWVADTHNHAIRRITPTGAVTVLAGNGTLGNADGSGTSALFNLPCGITSTASGNVVVADTHNHILRMVTPAGVVTTL